MISEKKAKKILQTYKEAWINQDIDKILSIYAPNGVLHEKIFEKAYKGHEEIKHYWKTKVCDEQSKIEFKLLNFYTFENVIIAEWDASFDSNIKNSRVHIISVAIFKIENDLIIHSKEFWQSEKKPLKK